ncbi:MAG TPA: biotin--[acetyl-CoA-carboxylase] ligase [Bacteroidales bacterium]|nr:biotin--[acetyl-CoA-carboxylase] ligase [Bacteroidales bacterium]
MIIGAKIIRREKVSSTNSVAAALLSTGVVVEGTVIIAAEQSEGKGQKGNRWESEPGKNLTISIILYPTFLRPDKQFYLSKTISLAIIDTLRSFCSDLSIKWPNDIYVRNDKIAGILIESSLSGDIIESCVAGIGLNVNQTRFISNAPNPVSLKSITGHDHDLQGILKILCSECDKWYNRLRDDELELIEKSYIRYMYKFGEQHLFESSGNVFSGTIRGVDEQGKLLIENAEGKILSFAFREVDFTHSEYPSR